MSGSTGSGAASQRWDAERFTKERDARQEPGPYREMRPRRGTATLVDDDRDVRRDRRSLFSGIPDIVQPAANDTQNTHLVPVIRPDRSRSISGGSRRRPDISPIRAGDDRDFRRPTLLRRQSSLDRFDLAASKRSHDYRRYDRDDYGPPVTPRKQISTRVPDIKPARSITPRGRRSSSAAMLEAPPPPRAKSRRASPKPGTTRIPKHMVAPVALEDLGYDYEEYEEDILIYKILTNDRIHELVEYSKRAREGAPLPRRAREKETVIIGAKDTPLTVERRPSVSRRRAGRTPSPPMEVRPVRPRHTRRRSSPIRVLEVADDHPERLLVPYHQHHHDLVAAVEAPEVVVKRDYKAPTPRLLRAMMATLT
ncbi:hypothetical protein MGYG_07594 [Nannizzia gypsea CBS 118893]|uniref:DUF8035 domain-containing protein n=1 Tax=Arthroderma gypseum (strain ATCC MYA-4604 / CBS 118893) TaxID=535722 RepID=E4V3L4_ARTGP|nr:hypothetical protein MGYG_07594 [Nannizzia gypsea CBS 118893]EFR04588.1 hypothetical protein MGYG_07594 [Nannizzia gypsea CBS 118893]